MRVSGGTGAASPLGTVRPLASFRAPYEKLISLLCFFSIAPLAYTLHLRAAAASTVLPARRGCLHRAGEPPQWMLQQAGEGDEIHVMLRPPASCSCRCRTVSSLRRRRPPRRHASIRPSKALVARVCFKYFRCFILVLQK